MVFTSKRPSSKGYFIMATNFNLDTIVDFIFAAEDDASFVQRYLATNFDKSYTQEQRIAIHRSVRNGVPVYARLRDVLLSGSVKV